PPWCYTPSLPAALPISPSPAPPPNPKLLDGGILGRVTRPDTAAVPRGRVLVADDEVALARALARWLTASGYKVDIAGDGHEAALDRKSTRLNSSHVKIS